MEDERTARRYTRLRWVGITLFAVACGVLAFRLFLVAEGSLPPVRGVLPALGALALALGCFGTANDTALHAMATLHRAGALPPRHAPEFHHERVVRPDRLDAAHASPRIALVLPLVTLVFLGWLVAGPLLQTSP